MEPSAVTFTADEIFAASVLATVTVPSISWQGNGDPDELEERFRRGKRSLRKKFETLGQAQAQAEAALAGANTPNP